MDQAKRYRQADEPMHQFALYYGYS